MLQRLSEVLHTVIIVCALMKKLAGHWDFWCCLSNVIWEIRIDGNLRKRMLITR